MSTKGRGSKCSKEKGEGNTKTSPPASKKWCFTANNYTPEEIEEFCSICSNIGRWFFGYEIGESGTKHLQGFIEFNTKNRPLTAFKSLQCSKWHWEKMKGTVEQNLTYCKKDGHTETNYGPWKQKKSLPVKKHEPIVLNELQETWLSRVQELCLDDRKIMWIWDEGGTGKSAFGRYLVEEYSALIVNGASKYCLSTLYKMEEKPEIIVYALARDKEDYVSYSALEQIRDGLFFSGFGTDGTGMCNFGFHPIVIVTCNFPPDYSKLSEDRWDVWNKLP